MKDFDNIRASANELAEEILSAGTEVTPAALGLDHRAGYMFFVGDDWIAVGKSSDGALQYYGGFEYEKDYRTEIGDYVFYSAESDRVREHLDNLEDGDE